jgi:transcriptional regulator with XRE-family HTH domain
MENTSAVASRYDIAKMTDDMAAKGWIQQDLADKAHVSHMSVSRFLRGERQTNRMAKRLSQALGYSVRRYLGQEVSR